MAHPNKIGNGDFSQDLNNWTITGTAIHKVDAGGNELGCAHLQTGGDEISQQFAIGMGRKYMIELATMAPSAAGTVTVAIKNQSGITIFSDNVTIKTEWKTYAKRVGLPWGNFTIHITYGDQIVYVDDVSIAHVIKTRGEIAKTVHDRLGVLATNASVELMPTDSGEDGFYSEPLDIGLRTVGAIDRAGRPDVRLLDAGTLDGCINEVELAALHKLHRYWATITDFSIGARQESQSQITAAIDRLIGTAVGGRNAPTGRGVKQRQLIHNSDKGRG